MGLHKNHIRVVGHKGKGPKKISHSVENQVKITYRRVYATFRNETFL